MARVAVVQNAPVLLNRDATLERAVALTSEAARAGARLIAFPEAFVPGYPTWIWRLRPGIDRKLVTEIHARLMASAVDLERDDLAPLRECARQHEVTVLCGIDERDATCSGGTLYNTYVTIGPDGVIANRHRKLMPTDPERMVWGFGDGTGLRVIETPCGRVGALICWESFMPLARYALYAQALELYVAPTWDSGERWIGTLQHIAREGRCWVAGAGTAMRVSDIPADFPERAMVFPASEEWINPGDSVVVDPSGRIVAGPLHEQQGILYAEIDLAEVASARRSLDVSGHYARPDIFRLTVNRDPQPSVVFEGSLEVGPPLAEGGEGTARRRSR